MLRVSSFHGPVEVGAAFFEGIGAFPFQEASKLGVVSHPPMNLAEELVRFHDGLDVVGTRVAHHGVHARVLLQSQQRFFQPRTASNRVLDQEVVTELHLNICNEGSKVDLPSDLLLEGRRWA